MNLCRSKTLLLLVVITALAFANPASAQQGAGGPAHEWGYFGDGQREEAFRIFLKGSLLRRNQVGQINDSVHPFGG